jgi:pyrimidine-nucleoside phosphorylase
MEQALAAASEGLLQSIERKRGGSKLADAEIEQVIADFTAGRTPDYQMAAWLATVACAGMDMRETAALTRAYIGTTPACPIRIPGRRTVDKHSTGGVGDKITLVAAPLAAACGVPVAKMSGRSLGWAGGTIDKLESIPGLRLDLSAREVQQVLSCTGMVITGQTAELAPGDNATYRLRDVTATVDSIPLIAASIVSKKVALAAEGLVLDVKTGAGALMSDPVAAAELAELMVELAAQFGIPARAIISDMSQPLGFAVGNALEIREALEVLQGREVPGVSELGRLVARLMLQVAEPSLSDESADKCIGAAIDSGEAYRTFLTWASAQGASPCFVDNPDCLPRAARRDMVRADRSGWVAAVDPRAIGQAALRAGAGRLVQNSSIDPGAGIILFARIGTRVDSGTPLAEVHHSGSDSRCLEFAAAAFDISPAPVPAPALIQRIFSSNHEDQP